MKLKNTNDGNTVYDHRKFGPRFGVGNDLYMYENGSNFYLRFGHSYESDHSVLLNTGSYAINEVEMFQVTRKSS